MDTYNVKQIADMLNTQPETVRRSIRSDCSVSVVGGIAAVYLAAAKKAKETGDVGGGHKD